MLSLLLPFGMISIFSLSSSHDDAVTDDNFDCVLGLSDSILSSSSKNGGFLLGVAFPVFLSSSLYWRYAVTRVWRRVLPQGAQNHNSILEDTGSQIIRICMEINLKIDKTVKMYKNCY